MRKFFSVFFLTFFAIPTLIFSIFTIGILKSISNVNLVDSFLTKTIQTTPKFLDELKNNIPNMSDEEKNEMFGQDIWLAKSLAQSNISFQEIFKETQLNNHLSLIKTNIVKHIKEQRVEDLIIKTDLIKNDLNKPIIKNSILSIIENLPECTSKQKANLLKQALSGDDLITQSNQENFCYLKNKEVNNQIVQTIQSKIIESIPSQYTIAKSKSLQQLYKIQNKTKFSIYLILIIPILFFTIAGFLYSDSKIIIIRVISIAIFIASLLSILLIKLINIVFQKLPITLNENIGELSRIELKIIQQIRNILIEFSSILTNPIFRISLTIMIASIVLFILSFFIKQSETKQIV